AWTLAKPDAPGGRWTAEPLWASAKERGHAGAARGVAFHPGGGSLATCGDDGTVRLWESDRGSLLRTIETAAGRLNDLAFRPDGRALAVAGIDGRIRVFEVETGRALADWPAGLNDLRALAYSPDGSLLAA